MKRISVGLLVLCALLVSPVRANEPVISITAPSGTIYVSSFPYSTSINLTINHLQLKDLNVFGVAVNGTDLFTDVGNPFDSSNNCKYPNMSVTSSCTTNGSDQATVAVPFTVASAGDYAIAVKVRHQGDEGTDVETASFLLVSIEYPAPPAIANAYINSTPSLKALAAKKRGCIISQIAINHGQAEKYGQKPGPYDTSLIQSDVDYYASSVCQ